LTKAIFFDWFNTVACYEPPRELLHSRLLEDFDIKISAEDLLPALLTADKYFYSENSHSMVDNRPHEEQSKIYFKYGSILLSEIGVRPEEDLVARIIKRWPEIKGKMRFALYDDVLPAVKKLKKRNLILGLITNATNRQISICRDLGLEEYLDLTITSEEAGVEKPDPHIFLMALDRSGVNAADTMHVGDQYEQDVIGAMEAGIKPVLIDRYNLYPDFTDCPRIIGMSEILQLL